MDHHTLDEKVKPNTMRKLSSCDVEALEKCLKENKGDRTKCERHIEAFKSSCSLKKSSPPEQPTQRISAFERKPSSADI